MYSLETNIGALKLKNPVLTASGTFGYGLEYADLCNLNALGGMVLKGTTLNPREGNPYPRMAETPAGMLNAVGLQNKGVRVLVNQVLPELHAYLEAQAAASSATAATHQNTAATANATSPAHIPTRVIVNLSGSCIEDYVEAAEILDAADDGKIMSAVELNISCPNVKQGGMAFGTDPKTAAEVVSAVRKAYKGCLIIKLSPNVSDIALMARAVEEVGADAVSLVNTFLGMEIDVEKQRALLSTITGGLSGPCIRPIALRMVYQVAKAVKIPVIGMGGIDSTRDALAFLMVGASAVEIGTANFENPSIGEEVARGIQEYLERKNISSVKDIIGIIK